MKRKTIAALAMLVILLVSLIGSAGAQGEIDDPVTEPITTQTEEPGAKFFTHPVVILLSAYFDPQTVDPLDPSSDPTVTDEESGLGPIGEQIAAYHEEGMGFGVLVKILAVFKASEDACLDAPADDPCKTLTDEERLAALDKLVEEFKESGMGAFMKTHKPDLLGVGHVRKALKAQEKDACEGTDCVTEKNKDPKDKSDKDKSDKDKSDKGKPDKGKGHDK